LFSLVGNKNSPHPKLLFLQPYQLKSLRFLSFQNPKNSPLSFLVFFSYSTPPHTHRTPSSQLLLRGCVLRNTAWCLGVVVFAGGEAKVAQNATAVPSKRSSLERRFDKLVAGVFVVLGSLAGVNAAAGAYLSLDPKMWYLALGESGERASTRALFDVAANRALVAGTTFLTSVALYSSLIPISLYVTIEVVKYAQAAVFISGDRLLYDAQSDTPATARTSNLNEDLGQVRWLLSDKTGTLTCNRMDFFGFSVGGEMYGGGGGGGGGGSGGGGIGGVEGGVASSSSPSSAAAVAPPPSSSAPPPTNPSSSITPSNLRSKFHDPRVSAGAWLSLPDAAAIAALMRALSLCHTVVTEENEEKKEEEVGGGAGGGKSVKKQQQQQQQQQQRNSSFLARAARRLPGRVDPAVSLTPLSAAAASSSSSSAAKRITVTYQAASPDEVALVSGAAQLGFPLLRRTPTGVVVGEPAVVSSSISSSSSPSPSSSSSSLTSPPSTTTTTVERSYDVLAVLEFSSARRRQSVIVRPAGAPADADCELICKGADAALGPLLLRGGDSGDGNGDASTIWKMTQRHLEKFGGSGLRTLCVASR